MISRLTVLTLLAISTTVFGQSRGPAGDVEQEFKMQELKWTQALQKGDSIALDAILASTYVDTDEDGHRTDKQLLLAAVKAHELKFDGLTFGPIRVHTYGDTTVVTGTAVQRGSYKGQRLPEHVAFTNTFVRQSGAWRAVASHRSTVKE